MKLPSLLLVACGLLLSPLQAQPSRTVAIDIDARNTGAPINPFIYGQFIEHLGRCIYGGIWAEMLEDRKFYFPVTADYAPYARLTETEFPVVGASPWEILGDAAGVTMTTDAPFVGKHSPRVTAGNGIRQHDLGVRADMPVDGYLWAKALAGRATLRVTLTWGDGSEARESIELHFRGHDFTRQTFSFTPRATLARGATFTIEVLDGDVVLGPPSLMPADNVRGLRADTLALLKQLDGTIYRWPGGNFVSGYNWRDGIGDRDRRPPRKNPAWTGVEHNDFGTDEFIAFCREIGTEPMIAANTGFGDAYSAAQWVEYTNGSSATLGGSWRAKNGHDEPYDVKYWCVGNEMFGDWQLGYMALPHYTIKHNEVSEAMWAVDPYLTLVGVGDLQISNNQGDADADAPSIGWSEGMLRESSDYMDMISEHFYRGRVPWTEEGVAPLAEHVGMLKESIRQKAEGHRKLQAELENLGDRRIPIAMDEWNYWHRDYVYGELGCVYDLADALGTAVGLHEYYRQSDVVQMAHYAQTVNVIGAIKTSRIAAEMEGTGLVLQLYRAEFGTTPLKLADDAVPAPLDAAAAFTPDGSAITLSVVNPTANAVAIDANLPGRPTAIKRWIISGADREAHNTPGQPRGIDIRNDSVPADAATLEVPALSATLFRIEVSR